MAHKCDSLITTCKGKVWEDPAVYGINKRSAHVELSSFQSVHDGLKYVNQIGRGLAAKPQHRGKLMLTGAWNFKLFPNPDHVQDDFIFGDKVEDWTKVNVPGNWETQGFGCPVYTNFKYPFDVNPPYVPADNPTGCYTTTFVLTPETLVNSHLSLVFDGVDSAFAVWFNATFVGYSQDSRLPAEFYVSDMCLEGENILAVQVMKWSDGSYLEDQDMWCLSGIFRDVYILLRPKGMHITDYQVQTPLTITKDGVLESAAVKATVHVSAEDAASLTDTSIKVHVYGPVTLGSAAKTDLIATVEGPVEVAWAANDTTGQPNAQAARKGGRACLEIPAESLQGKVAPWSAEEPAVYCLVVEAYNAAASTVWQVEATQLAFRHTSIVDGKLLHNGSPIMLRGVNRHEHDPYNGKVISEDSMVADILLMKQANFNAVRMSHYPNTQRFYQLCTALGLYAVDEANLETHGFDAALCKNYLNPANSPVWIPCMLDRAVRMFEQNKNHGCIVAWSIGNESGYGAVHAAMAAFIRQRDPSRVLHYEGGGSCTAATDLICPMYARKQQIESMARQHADRPIVLCEYAHAMGNSGGGLAEYWRLFESNDRCQGGFVWDWVDQGLMMKECMPGYAGVDYWCYGGDFRDAIHDAQFCINGLMFPNREPHPSLHEIKHVQAAVHITIAAAAGEQVRGPLLAVAVSNRYDFVSLSHVSFQWRVTMGGAPVHFASEKPSIAPQEVGVPVPPAVVTSTSTTAQLALQSVEVDPEGAQEQAWHAMPAADSINAATPGQTISTQVEITKDQLQHIASLVLPGADVFMEVRAVTRENSFWAPAGHTIVCTQLDVSSEVLAAIALHKGGPLGHNTQGSSNPGAAAKLYVESSATAHLVSVHHGDSVDWEATIDVATGMLSSWKKGDCTVLQTPAELCLMRAPTDNDLGGSEGTSHAARWLGLGLDRELVPTSCTTTVTAATDSHVVIEAAVVMAATGKRIVGETSGSGGASLEVGGAHWFAEAQGEAAPATAQEDIDGSIGVTVTYEFSASGVGMQWQVDISRFMPTHTHGHINSLARIGTRLQLPADLQMCAWMGRGPHENYIDRQDGALVRLYSSEVSALHTPYIAPSENGGRGGVRWVALMPQKSDPSADTSSCPVVVAAAQPVVSADACQLWPADETNTTHTSGEQPDFCPRDCFHFSASCHSIQDLIAAKHDHDLPKHGPCYLHLDGMHMGVGGDDSWTPSVHTRYLIRKGVYKFAVALQLLDADVSLEGIVQAASHMQLRSKSA